MVEQVLLTTECLWLNKEVHSLSWLMDQFQQVTLQLVSNSARLTNSKLNQETPTATVIPQKHSHCIVHSSQSRHLLFQLLTSMSLFRLIGTHLLIMDLQSFPTNYTYRIVLKAISCRSKLPQIVMALFSKQQMVEHVKLGQTLSQLHHLTQSKTRVLMSKSLL